jgi:chromosome segregation ATPase
MSFFRSFRKSAEVTPPTPAVEAAAAEAENKDKAEDAATDTTPPEATTDNVESAAAPADDDEDAVHITVEDEPADDPVRTKLEKEVRLRDVSISALEKARQEKRDELMALERELEQERLTQMKEALIHKIESERIKRQTSHTEERLKALEADMQDKAAIHEYANLIKGVAPKGGVDSQYVIKLQAQLQKAVKKMETTNEQMQELEENSRQVVTNLTVEISELVEERCMTELELRKQMEVLQEHKDDMQIKYEARIRENLKTLQALRAKAASQVTIDELEEELQDAEARLEELQRVQERQEKTIRQLTKQLAAESGGQS